jgi:hypothetical protein
MAIILQETAATIRQDFELFSDENFLTEAQLLAALATHVEEMLKNRIEVLMSTLYRLDVSEVKVAKALSPDALMPPHFGIAQLIIDRQKQRIETKNTYKTPPLDDWIDF